MSERSVFLIGQEWTRQRRTRALGVLSGLVVVLSGCSGGSGGETAGPTAETGAPVQLQPDLSHLRDGCHHPCSLSIYESPARSQLDAGDPQYREGYVNDPANEPGANTPWPHEAGSGLPADALTIVCQVRGEELHDSDGNSSFVWDVAKVPADKLNAIAAQQAASATPPFGVEKDGAGQVTSIYGFAADIWLGNQGVRPELPACSAVQNPGGYASATS